VNHHQLVLCTYVLSEFRDTLSEKFNASTFEVDGFLNEINYTLFASPSDITEFDKPIMRDIDDMPVLYSAIKSNVDILVTGDKDFFDFQLERPRIIKTHEFINEFISGKQKPYTTT
jgi:predicted nucleic acid-binding protein